MKTQGIFLAVLVCFLFGNVSAQEKQIKSNTNKATISADRLDNLLDSKTFEFIATRAFPLSGTPKNLAGDSYTVTFSPEMIVSNLPFYGKAYSAVGMTEDTGMSFKGKPENFTVTKKDGYRLYSTVHDGDTYRITLSVSDSGYGRLTINSNDRETISYQGEIVEVSIIAK
ncbi:DUF4251 domain-containing protein [Aequorivita sp. H23M31]|uniref:DUF4251 domain-containing protein n=1 Tax=Aequorivita ciconiae TaxID=2494375 RepID=A0A410G2H1_9FLAO|nr:DUF4251 domain-containing protein [Aequorivita sp. H23M31]QAA81484.1 DUF4251 domain-containing protein [Aequorivita sp. H23M31]